MERPLMFKNQQNLYCGNGYTFSKRNPQIQWNLNKNFCVIFTEIEASILRSMWKHKSTQIDKPILSKKSTTGTITAPEFILYYRALTTTTVWYSPQNRKIGQQSRTEDPNINPLCYSHPAFNKGAINIYCRKGSLFNKWCWENWISTCRRLELDLCPHLT
jgi:hypothetical protein